MSSKRFFIIISAVILAAAVFTAWRYYTAGKAAPKKLKPAAPAVKKEAALPVIEKKVSVPKVAIVMDDFGYNMNNVEDVIAINKAVTFSVLPDLKYSAEIAKLACSRGYEVILHLPLEPGRKDVKEEVNTIRSAMNDKDVIAQLDRELASVPGASGASNHMGSRSTEEKPLMTLILAHLKNKGLYFFDSLTSEKSVCRELAASIGIRYAQRDMFLDNSGDTAYIEKQLLALRKLAFRRGCAIGVCHDRKNTVAVLRKMMPKIAKDGIHFVFLSELVKRQE